MIEISEQTIKNIFVVYMDGCPVWKNFEPIWFSIKQVQEADNLHFYEVDGMSEEGLKFCKDRFITTSPTIISNEGMRLVWKNKYTKQDFIDKFLKQENVLGNV